MPLDQLESLIGENVHVAFEADGPETGRWTVSHATVQERMSAPYEIVAELVAHQPIADATALLGASCRLRVSRRNAPVRLFPGIVEEVTGGPEASGRLSRTTCTVRIVPALELLAHGRASRIFQHAKVTQILTDVLTPALAAYEREVSIDVPDTYPEYEYRTQYDESDLAFVQRMMGEAGLFSFFDTSGPKEKLVIVDDPSKYPALSGSGSGGVGRDTLRFAAADGGGNETVRTFARLDRTRPTTVSLRHYDWPRPGNFVEGQLAPEEDEPAIGAARGPVREIYEHDAAPLSFHAFDTDLGQYTENDSQRQVELRRHQHVQEAVTFVGSSNAIGLAVGTAFKLTGHPRPELDGAYVIVAITHSIDVGDTDPSDTSAEGFETTYGNSFRCVRADVPYRAPRQVKPLVRGILTATVVGPSGEEIHTDTYGRVKVQFHFDRKGENDDRSSCFLRVVQPWAGAGWGFVFIPRVGMEAVVTFLDGDPDRPIVTGTVYNGDNQPPYSLPIDSTRSVLRTQSTPGGGGYNELSFDDAAGAEEVHLQAQRDLRELVKNDHRLEVRNNQTYLVAGLQTIAVGINRSVNVGLNEEILIGASRTETVTGPETIRLLATRDTDVVGSDKLVVHAERSEEIHGPLTADYHAGRTVTVENGDTETISDSNKTVRVEGRYDVEVTDRFHVKRDSTTICVEEAIELASPTKVLTTVGGNHVDVDEGGTVTVTAETELVLQCGSSKIVLKSDGTIQISGSTKVEVVSGSTNVASEPAGFAVTGTQVDLNGSAQVNIVGGMVKVN